MTDRAKTFRFASTAPFYVEVGAEKKRISRASTRFFVKWIEERMARVKVDDPDKRREVLKHHEAALGFWRERLEKANAD